MKPSEIKLSDWMRIVFGETSPDFFVEVVIRTLVIFLLLIVGMRLYGRRMAAQISRIELVALFSFAAAIGVPLQAPDRGILPAVVIAIVVILVGRLVATLMFGNETFEARVRDRLTIVINDGVFDLKKIKGTSLTTERLFAQLRSSGIRHLGEVKRLYFQSTGSFSLVKEEQPPPGLSVLPAIDKDFINEQPTSEEKVCKTCGNRQKNNGQAETCCNCGDVHWVPAIC